MNQRHQQYPKGKSEHPFVVSNYFADYIFAIYTSLGWISCSHGTTLGLMGVSLSRKIIISCAFGICQNYDQGCGADVTRSGSNYKISLGWVYGPQYHVILARFFFVFFLFLLFWKTKLPNINLRSFHWRNARIKLQKPLQSITVVRIKVALLSIPVS